MAFELAGFGLRARLLTGLFERVSVFLRASLAALSLEPAPALATAAVTFSIADQNVRELRGAAPFGGSLLSREAAVEQAVVLGGELGEAGLDAVVIGQDQAVRGDEGGRAIREPDGGQPHVIQPCWSHLGAVSPASLCSRGNYRKSTCLHRQTPEGKRRLPTRRLLCACPPRLNTKAQFY